MHLVDGPEQFFQHNQAGEDGREVVRVVIPTEFHVLLTRHPQEEASLTHRVLIRRERGQNIPSLLPGLRRVQQPDEVPAWSVLFS